MASGPGPDDLGARAAHVAGELAARLRAAEAATSGGAALATTPAAQLVARPPVVVAPEVSVREAAQRMRDERISSVVVDRRPWALVTDRVLRDRVVARARSPDTPVGDVARPDVPTVRVDATAGDVLDAMLAGGRHHALLTEDGTDSGRLRGVVTTGDLLRRQADSPVHVVRTVRGARTASDLATTPQRCLTMARALLGAGLDAPAVLRALTAVSDAATDAATRIAVDEHGDPGVAWAWVAVGSQARREQGLVTDQDHVLVHDPADEQAGGSLARLAARTVELLEAAGLPPCRGETMATRWRADLPTWERRFREWVATPDQSALYAATIFFDLRRVAGDLGVGVLTTTLAHAGADELFLARLAATAARARPAIGRFHRLRSDRDGRIDVKAGGLVPIVDLARLLSIEAGAPSGGTIDRLQQAGDAGVLSGEGRDLLTEAFGFLQRLRLEHHLACLDGAGEPDNRIDPDGLSRLDGHHLREVLAEVATIQRLVLGRLGADDVAG